MKDKIKVASLFSGIGGFEQGIKNSKLNFELVFASEIDKYATLTYGCNYNTKVVHGDIKEINENEIPDHDILCGGFPCQSFSVAGKRLGFNDIRGTLFFDVIRILKEKKPKILFLENVKNLISHDNGNTIKVILETISNCNYTFDISIINSNEAGVPQSRERTYIVAYKSHPSAKFDKDLRNNKINEIKQWANNKNLNTMNFFNKVKFKSNKKSLEDILYKFADEKYYLNSINVCKYLNSITLPVINNKQNKIIKILDLPREIHNDLDRQRRVYSPKGISPTLLARSDSPKILLQTDKIYRIRKITPLEALRIQGFDEKYVSNLKLNIISDTQLYKQAGNAVSPPVIEGIINTIKEDCYEGI